MSNKIPCGGFYLDDMLSVNDSGELSIKGGLPYQQLVTDENGNTKWEDRLAYEYTEWKDFTIADGETIITGFSMPPVGDTVTVKVNGVESVETVKSGESDGFLYSYIGSTDLAGLMSGTNGWLVLYIAESDVLEALANPETTVSLPITEQHKIDEKYIQQDKNFVRPLSYYIGKVWSVFKHYYNESGEEIIAYKTNSIILPHDDNVCIDDVVGNAGIGKFGSVNSKAFFVTLYEISSKGTINVTRCIYGTEETYIAELAARYGYTLTTKPTT